MTTIKLTELERLQAELADLQARGAVKLQLADGMCLVFGIRGVEQMADAAYYDKDIEGPHYYLGDTGVVGDFPISDEIQAAIIATAKQADCGDRELHAVVNRYFYFESFLLNKICDVEMDEAGIYEDR